MAGSSCLLSKADLGFEIHLTFEIVSLCSTSARFLCFFFFLFLGSTLALQDRFEEHDAFLRRKSLCGSKRVVITNVMMDGGCLTLEGLAVGAGKRGSMYIALIFVLNRSTHTLLPSPFGFQCESKNAVRWINASEVEVEVELLEALGNCSEAGRRSSRGVACVFTFLVLLYLKALPYNIAMASSPSAGEPAIRYAEEKGKLTSSE